MSNTIYLRFDKEKRLYLRAIIGTRLPYTEEKYQTYMKFFDKGRCVWDEKVLIGLKESELKNLYEMLDQQIESDYRYKENDEGRLIDPDET